MNSLLVLSLSAVAVIQSISAKAIKKCTDESESMLIIRDGLNNFKKLNKAGHKKVSFLALTSELEQAHKVLEKFGSYSVVWALNKEEIEKARKYRHKSKKLKRQVEKLMKTYKKETEKKLKIVTLPSGTSSKIVKAFEKKKVIVIKAAHKASNAKKTKKLAKKAKKAHKKGENIGGITFFTADDKNGPKQLKKLRRAMKKVVKARKCFRILKKNEFASEDIPGVLKSGSFENFESTLNFGSDDIEIFVPTSMDNEDVIADDNANDNANAVLSEDENDFVDAVSEQSDDENEEVIADAEVKLVVIPDSDEVLVPSEIEAINIVNPIIEDIGNSVPISVEGITPIIEESFDPVIASESGVDNANDPENKIQQSVIEPIGAVDNSN